MNAIQLLQLPLFQGISEAAARQLLAEAPNSVHHSLYFFITVKSHKLFTLHLSFVNAYK